MNRESFEFEKSEIYNDMGNMFLNFTEEYYFLILLSLLFIIALILISIVYLLYKRNKPLKDIEKELKEDIKKLNKEKIETLDTNLNQINSYYLKDIKSIKEEVMSYSKTTERSFKNANEAMQTVIKKISELCKIIDNLKKDNEEYIESSLIKHKEVVKDRDNKGRQIFKLRQQIKKNNNKNG